jgi:Ca2+-binding EF-hand superfamily protein
MKGLNNAERYFVFDHKLVGKVSQSQFIEGTLSLGIRGVRELDVVELFKRVDVSRSGFVSENEFRLMFDTEDGQIKNEKDIKLTREM